MEKPAGERPALANLHPRVRTEQANYELNAKMAELYEAAAFYELQLEQDLQAGDTDTYTKRANAIVEELDARWPYEAATLQVVGTWHTSTFEIDQQTNEPTISTQAETAMEEATSQGFWVDIIEGKPRVGLMFSRHQQTTARLHYMHLTATPLAFAPLQDISLSHPPLIYDEDRLMFPQYIYSSLHMQHGIMELYKSRSNFYSLPGKRQYSVLKDLVEAANEQLYTNEITAIVGVKALKGYHQTDTGYESISAAKRGKKLRAQGRLLGATVLELDQVQDAPIRERSDFIDPYASLQLAISCPQGTFSAPIADTDILYVPYGRITKMQLSIVG